MLSVNIVDCFRCIVADFEFPAQLVNGSFLCPLSALLLLLGIDHQRGDIFVRAITFPDHLIQIFVLRRVSVGLQCSYFIGVANIRS